METSALGLFMGPVAFEADVPESACEGAARSEVPISIRIGGILDTKDPFRLEDPLSDDLCRLHSAVWFMHKAQCTSVLAWEKAMVPRDVLRSAHFANLGLSLAGESSIADLPCTVLILPCHM